MSIVLSTAAVASDAVKLPVPDKSNSVSLMQALENRRSIKEFTGKPIDNQTLSSILWVAYGVNRSDGHRVIPTAMNEHDLNVYVFDKKGVWMYDATEHAIHPIDSADKRSLFQTQDYMTNVPVILVYTGSAEYAPMHAGSAYQNVELYASAHDMASVVRAYFDKEAVAQTLRLKAPEHVLISQAIGWPK